MEINFFQILIDSFYPALKVVWPIYLSIAIIVFYRGTVLIIRYIRLKKAGIPEIDKMQGSDFESFLSIMFSKRGFKVNKVASSAGDYGADLIVEKNGNKIAIQAKRYKGVVGINSVREAYGSINYYKTSRAMVITNNYFTLQARILAKVNSVILWDRNELAKNILSDQWTI